MNWEQLKTILWLRWRLMGNQWRRSGGLGAVIAVLVGAGAFMLAALGFTGGLLGGDVWPGQSVADGYDDGLAGRHGLFPFLLDDRAAHGTAALRDD